MTGEPVEREAQYDLGRSRRPAPLALDVLETFEEATDVEQKAGEFRSDRVERLVHPPPRIRHGVGWADAATAGAARHRARPVDAGVRHEVGHSEVATQALARLQLMRLDQRAAAARTTASEPE